MKNKSRIFLASCLSIVTLGGCADLEPFVEDWQRERYQTIQKYPLLVRVCFDKNQNSRKQVLDVARQECTQRIKENETLIELQKLVSLNQTKEAEGEIFQGPVQREKVIEARASSLQLKYVENDVWECPILLPNRITLQCNFDRNASDSIQNRQSVPDIVPEPDLPPELPDDLKP